MDTLIDKVLPSELHYMEIYGTSEDDKPTGNNMASGSVFIEVDTGKAYLYERTAGEWYEAGGT